MSNPVNYRIHGEDLHIIEIMLPPGGAFRAESGALVYMDTQIQMDTPIQPKFIDKYIKSKVGEPVFNPVFRNKGLTPAKIAFSPPYPGQVIPLDLNKHTGAVICQKGAYLCGTLDVKISIAFTKSVAAGLFGKEGFVMQKLTGTGLVFIHCGGTILQRFLEPGEAILADITSLAAFDSTVAYDVTPMPGFVNKFLGGEGMWLIHLEGPGWVFLQSTPFNVLAQQVGVTAPPPKP